MSVPSIFLAPLRLRFLPALLLFLAVIPCFAKGAEPPLRLPLESLGYQPLSARLLTAGGTLATVNFIDDQHLLVTFSVRRLMKRMPDALPDDEDRTVEAVVLHLPTGNVLARTHWRLHDSGQYLWNLGHGRFLLRIRDILTTFVPLENLTTGDPFAEQPFLNSTRLIAAVQLSADNAMITVETLERKPPAPDGSVSSRNPGRVQVNFYRIVQPVQPTDKVIVQYAGIAVARGLIDISITAAGYIETYEERPDRWLFDFDSYTGKTLELSPFDTTCRPHATFVSSSEFVAFGCRGSSDRQDIGGFNMRGEQMWQQDFQDTQAFPAFAFAPSAGRFALSRNIVASGSGTTVDFAPSTFTTQEIRVYQTDSGKQLLRAECSPVQRAGQNFDLSPDGLRLATLRNDAIEVYRLPVLTSGDEAAIRAAKALQPENTGAVVNLVPHRKPVSQAAAPTGKTQPSAEAPEAAPADEPSSTSEPRKPPTLYTLPEDKPTDKPPSKPQ